MKQTKPTIAELATTYGVEKPEDIMKLSIGPRESRVNKDHVIPLLELHSELPGVSLQEIGKMYFSCNKNFEKTEKVLVKKYIFNDYTSLNNSSSFERNSDSPSELSFGPNSQQLETCDSPSESFRRYGSISN